MSLDYFNCKDHKLHIKGEVIASSGIWIAKKRYAMLKTYDLEKNMAIEPKLGVKGLDIIRSTFPQYFKKYMRSFIIDILKGLDKDQIDDEIKNIDPLDLAKKIFSNNNWIFSLFRFRDRWVKCTGDKFKGSNIRCPDLTG